MEMTAPTTNNILLKTVREVAKELRVDPYTVREWIKKGTLDAITLPNGNYRIKQSTLDKMLGA